jgi:hypothetical protein
MTSSVLILGFLACGDSKTDTAEPTAEPTNEAAIEPSGEDTADTAEEVATFAISGSVVLGDGSPAVGSKIQVCAALCRRADVSEDGTWSLTGVEEAVYIILSFSQGDTSIATTVSLIEITEDKEIGSMTLHPYATQEAYVSGMHDYVLDGGLTLSLDSDELSAGVYSLGSSDTVSSIKINPAEVPNDVDSSEILAMWMLGDFDHHVEGGIAWRIDSDLGLEEGTSLTFKYLDNEGHEWAEVGTFTITDGVIDGGDTRLPLLSTIMVVQN